MLNLYWLKLLPFDIQCYWCRFHWSQNACPLVEFCAGVCEISHVFVSNIIIINDIYKAQTSPTQQIRQVSRCTITVILERTGTSSVVSWTLAVSEMFSRRRSAGRLFHTTGPWTAKLQSAYLVLVRGTVSWLDSAERRWHRPPCDDVCCILHILSY